MRALILHANKFGTKVIAKSNWPKGIEPEKRKSLVEDMKNVFRVEPFPGLLSVIIFAFLIYVSQNGQFITYIKLCAFIYPVIGQVLWYLDFRMDLVVSKKVRYSLDI